jgi:hypothetical protein
MRFIYLGRSGTRAELVNGARLARRSAGRWTTSAFNLETIWIAGHALESAFIKPGFTSRRNAIATLTLVSYQWLHALPVRQALRMLDQAVTDYIDAWIAA